MTLHAITGSDTTSAIFGQGKKKAFLLAQKESLDALNVLANSGSSKDDIACAGEQFLLKLYGAHTFTTLDKYRYRRYNQSVSRSSLSSCLKLESLPPTCAAAAQHSYRTYLTVQQWKGNKLNPTDWGWRVYDKMIPVETNKDTAPNSLLNLVSCGCKTGCGKTCVCWELGLHWTPRCSHCEGQTCTNIADSYDEEEDIAIYD
jgi:hypothetical protein